MSGFASLLAGCGATVELASGARRRYVNMDHAASTPPFLAVLDAVAAHAPSYANVHRGRGWASQRSTQAFEEAREDVRRFLGVPADQLVIFTRNTTESLNHAAARLPVRPGQVVISTVAEHHSNDLPWRRRAPVLRAGVDAAGRVDENQLLDLLTAHRGRIAALAVSAASNVTGDINPVHRWAGWAHAYGAPIVVDAAQLVPHRPLDIRSPDDPERLDYVAFSAHKMYAPFGVGVLVAPRAVFEYGAPWQAGGGTVDVVDEHDVAWTASPERDEAGTPCVLGAIALAEAIRQLRRIGPEALRAHEDRMTALVRRALAAPGVRVYGPPDGDRLGVFAFNVDGVPHALAAAVLADEHGIGSRNGCFCAHQYVKAMLGIDAEQSRELSRRIVAGDRSAVPGMVRVSLGLASTPDDAERLATAVRAIAEHRYARGYALDRATGEYRHPTLTAVA